MIKEKLIFFKINFLFEVLKNKARKNKLLYPTPRKKTNNSNYCFILFLNVPGEINGLSIKINSYFHENINISNLKTVSKYSFCSHVVYIVDF